MLSTSSLSRGMKFPASPLSANENTMSAQLHYMWIRFLEPEVYLPHRPAVTAACLEQQSPMESVVSKCRAGGSGVLFFGNALGGRGNKPSKI